LFPNSVARAVTNTPKFHHVTAILKSLYWLKITERFHYKILSITYKCLLSDKPAYLRNLPTVQSSSTIRSSSVITLKRPYNPSSLEVSIGHSITLPCFMEHLAKRISTIQLHSRQNSTFAFPAITFSLSQET
jgi:hypothetical protein